MMKNNIKKSLCLFEALSLKTSFFVLHGNVLNNKLFKHKDKRIPMKVRLSILLAIITVTDKLHLVNHAFKTATCQGLDVL